METYALLQGLLGTFQNGAIFLLNFFRSMNFFRSTSFFSFTEFSSFNKFFSFNEIFHSTI